MAEGYFSSGEGSSPNAAADFRQLNALNPDQFSGRGLFDKLFRKAAPAAQPAAQAAAPQAVTPAITTGRFGAFTPPSPGMIPPPPGADMMPPLPQPPAPVAPRSWLDELFGRPRQPVTNQAPPRYMRGGLAMMRGGYPAHLMMGLPQRFARGGPDYVSPDGRGDGRSDHVEARLSPGEFVQDAETTALLGNGDGEAGARGWEAIRQEIREDKGKALAQGKFSPNAKSPAHYAKVGMRAARGRK
ncbi:MAG: hypothetical protein V4597_17500 [Pseudomonadota bacterium]